MTRFFITLPQAVKFVIKCFGVMNKGEVFIPKIPSFKIIDLAKALNSNVKFNVVGIRPGEKIDESLCSQDESSNLLEFKDYFTLVQLNTRSEKNRKQLKSKYKNAKIVSRDFSYTSKNNPDFLSIKEIKKLLSNI
jgi:UDP-N-acetylglucosamine 4,6-dehydratase